MRSSSRVASRRVRVLLPRSAAESPDAHATDHRAEDAPAGAQPRHGRILLVDDDNDVREFSAECLKAKLDGADFHKARLRSVSLEQVSAVKTRFVLADLSDALLLMADLSGADLTGADLTGATLEAANLRGATLALTNLTQANLKNADLTDANWWRARGLSQEQLIRFAADFPPTDAADPSRIQDYLLWADSFGSSTDSTRKPPVDAAAGR